MSTPVDPFSASRLPATLRGVRTLCIVGAAVASALLVFVVAIELLLPIDDLVVVRDGIGLALAAAASWALVAVAGSMTRALPQPTGAYGAILAIMIGVGGVSLVLNFVLDVVLLGGGEVVAIAVPAALVIGVVVPGVYLAFTARAIRRVAAGPRV